jgi:hypothetical protein
MVRFFQLYPSPYGESVIVIILLSYLKNNVFSGSAVCQSGSYSIQIDLFSSKNEIIARHYDALDQGGPDSNIVSITFNDNASKVDISSKISMTSTYARKGANPNQLLTWPIVITGGLPPYAVSVDWGDGTTNDLYTVTVPGEFFIKHKFEASGSYRALIKSTDKNGSIAFLQLVAIANGESKDTAVAGATAEKSQGGPGTTRILWQPVVFALPFIFLTFWLGKKYEIKRIKQKLEHGEHPFQ